MTSEQPLFANAENALRFAFSICETEIYAPPVYVQEAVRQMKRTKRAEQMSPHDWHCQGAMIRGMVAKLDTMQAAYGWACHAYSADRATAVEIMEAYAHAGLPSLKNKQLLSLILRRRLNKGRGQRMRPSEIASEVGCHHSTVAQWERRMGKLFDALHWQFYDAIHGKLADAGLIPSD